MTLLHFLGVKTLGDEVIGLLPDVRIVVRNPTHSVDAHALGHHQVAKHLLLDGCAVKHTWRGRHEAQGLVDAQEQVIEFGEILNGQMVPVNVGGLKLSDAFLHLLGVVGQVVRDGSHA